MSAQSRHHRQLNPASSIETLKKEAKRWLKNLRDGDDEARARLLRSHPDAPDDAASVTLRDVQHASRASTISRLDCAHECVPADAGGGISPSRLRRERRTPWPRHRTHSV